MNISSIMPSYFLKRASIIIIGSAWLCLSCRHQTGKTYTLQKSASSESAMVVSAHPLASEVGMHILKMGGNAADAAIAVQLTLAVVHPRAGNIGGGGFLVYRNQSGELFSLDFREKAPMAASRDMFLDSAFTVNEEISKKGLLASGVPGTVAGLIETHQKLGNLKPFSVLVQPAIQFAEKGFRITALEAARLNKYRNDFKQFNPPDMPFLARKVWKEGDVLIQKELAETLRLIASQGHDGFYKGKNAETLIRLHQSQSGIITSEDLSKYKAIWREPLTTSWRGFDIHTMGLPSSGGIVLAQILGMIEHRLSDEAGFRDPGNIHLITEAARRAFADRANFLGDPEFYPVVLDSLLDPLYLNQKMNDFDPLKASLSHSISADLFMPELESFETTHISITDAEGNAAAMTTTLNENYGCKVWVPGGGYFLNNQMDDFSVKPGTPNAYGLIGAEANAIAPGKRMLSSMTPTIIVRNDQLFLVLGSPGGPAIITSILQVFLHLTSFGMDIDQAVQTPRFHHQWIPDEIRYEPDAFSAQLISDLEELGHRCIPIDQIGAIEAIYLTPGGIIHGAADRRSDDHAVGW